MRNIRVEIENNIQARFPEHFEYIMNDSVIKSEIDTAERFEMKNDSEMADFVAGQAMKKAENFVERALTPATANVGDGVTIHLWSDAHAATIIKKTKTTITVQHDKATLDPNFKPEFVAGGFAGHCTNNNDQTYTYERNENGTIETFRWSKKNNRYQNDSIRVTKGRREFHDYNF